ncbi:MAG: PAS domain S-box protein [Solirubrobacteraceae bacterium]
MSTAPPRSTLAPGRRRRRVRHARAVGPRDGTVSEFEAKLEPGTLLEFSIDAVIAVSPDGVVGSWNEGAERLFGCARSEAIGRGVSTLWHPAHVADIEQLMDRALAGDPAQAIVQHTGPEGSAMELLVSTSPIRHDGGGIVGLAAVIRDVTGQRHIEAELKMSELRYRSVVEALSEGVALLDADGAVVAMNDSAEAMFGLTETEVTTARASSATPLLPLISEDGSPFPPEEAPGRLAIRTGELQTDVILGVVRRAGDTRWLSVNSRPLRHAEDGKIYGAVSSYSDVTEQRKTEAVLRESEERYRGVVESLNEGIIIVDRDGRLVAFNGPAMTITGRSAMELVDRTPDNPVVDLIHDDGSPVLVDETPSWRALRTGERQTGEVLGVRQPDGSVRWVLANSSPLRRPGESEPYGAVATLSDITAQRQALNDLKVSRLEDLKRLALVSEYRDDETNRHTERVARTAQLLAVELGLDGMQVWTIGRAAPLHDVGKVGIPDDILLKPGRLSDNEFDVMKTHTSIGATILGESEYQILQLASEIAVTHHERWDGGGYPNGLSGKAIPIAGRIVAVADAFDAMTHDRPYKAAIDPDDAVEELKRCSGTQFDPRIVEAFLRLDHYALVDRD